MSAGKSIQIPVNADPQVQLAFKQQQGFIEDLRKQVRAIPKPGGQATSLAQIEQEIAAIQAELAALQQVNITEITAFSFFCQ